MQPAGVTLSEKTQQLVDDRKALLIERTQSFLEPGEVIQVIFTAGVGMNPSGGTIIGALSLLNKKIIIAATDRAVVLLDARRRYEPKGVASRLPRTTRLGPPTTRSMRAAHARLSLPDSTYISSIWRGAVEEADALAPPE